MGQWVASYGAPNMLDTSLGASVWYSLLVVSASHVCVHCSCVKCDRCHSLLSSQQAVYPTAMCVMNMS